MKIYLNVEKDLLWDEREKNLFMYFLKEMDSICIESYKNVQFLRMLGECDIKEGSLKKLEFIHLDENFPKSVFKSKKKNNEDESDAIALVQEFHENLFKVISSKKSLQSLICELKHTDEESLNTLIHGLEENPNIETIRLYLANSVIKSEALGRTLGKNRKDVTLIGKKITSETMEPFFEELKHNMKIRSIEFLTLDKNKIWRTINEYLAHKTNLVKINIEIESFPKDLFHKFIKYLQNQKKISKINIFLGKSSSRYLHKLREILKTYEVYFDLNLYLVTF